MSVAKKKIKRIWKLYPPYLIGSLIFVYFLFKSQFAGYLFWIVLLLLLKDLLIDLGGLRLIGFRRFKKTSSFPILFEHGPLVIIVSLIGILGLTRIVFVGLIPLKTTIVAIIDTPLDVLDDLGLL